MRSVINRRTLAVFGCLALLYGMALACGLVHFQVDHLGLMVLGSTTPFPTNPTLTAIAIAYRNPDVALIADQVLPRIDTDESFSWMEYDLAQGFTIPDTQVGRKSVPNEVDFSGTERQAKVQDYGLDDIIPNRDIAADNRGVDPRGRAVEYLTGLVHLGREKRVADLVFNAANYAAANVLPLSGTSQWSDPNSDPVAAIGDALDSTIIRPNVATFGQVTWTKLRRNPKLVNAIKGGTTVAGMVSRQEFADLFELQEVLVGQSNINLAKKGQPVNMQRTWGKHASFFFRDRSASNAGGVTFGFTAQWGGWVAGEIAEQKTGLRGAVRVRSGESVKEIICAKDVGFLFQNAVA
ncbi:MAG: phage capsid protein [Proteobacteria bacterium]|nr:phage capsid protein [Pseudomonadota bacterium]